MARGEREYKGYRTAMGYGVPYGQNPGEYWHHDFGWLNPGRHSYRRGTKVYRRSDQRLLEDICETIGSARHVDPSDVCVDVWDGTVRLDGTVPARYMKHAIEDLADTCPGVLDIENRIRVRA